MMQQDKNDCKNHNKEDGYVRACNAMRKYMLISCWTLDDFNILGSKNFKDKILSYCSFKDKEGVNDCDIAYAVKTTVGKLQNFIDMKCSTRNVFSSLHTFINYSIRTGMTDYVDIETLKQEICSKASVFPFEKDLFYENEHEYRLFLERDGVFEYDVIKGCYVLKTDDCPNVDFMQGNPKDFLTGVYRYDRRTDKISEINIPIVRAETLIPTLWKPTTPY